MSTEQQDALPQSTAEKIIKLRPTLFIALGGTGMEVICRVRRRILNASWGGRRAPVRLDSMADFPVAQFIHFDLAHDEVETGRSQNDDVIWDLVKLPEDDRLIETFKVEKYSRNDDDLARYPLIEAWSPLTPKRIRELNIRPEKGAGQIRGFSRLYFFDKYLSLKPKIHNKLLWLKSGLSKDAKLKSLGLDLDSNRFRVVVVGSSAGGTGSGTFLDMGWLARAIAKEAVSEADVELYLFMPGGYQKADKGRTEANGYAAAMELETAMRGGSNYVSRWDVYDRMQLDDAPYDEIYLIDNGNLAQLQTSEVTDVYDMVADALFEDFASADFATKKRSTAVNQRKHKLLPFSPPVPHGRYGDMSLAFFSGFSAFGQAILDTQDSLRRDIRIYSWTIEMLKAFFGVGAVDIRSNRATDKQRDEFMQAQLHLEPQTFSDFPDLSSKDVDLKLATGEFTDYRLTDDLLNDHAGANIVSGIQQKVDTALENIVGQFDRKEWGIQVRQTLRSLEKDVVRDQDSTADVSEDRVMRRAAQIYEEVTGSLRGRLFEYLDNKEFGGLEFVLSLVEQIKDRLEKDTTGVIPALQLNAKRYAELRDAVRTAECERLLGHLDQTRGFSILGNAEKQARQIIDQLKTEIGNSLKFHVRAKAAAEAAALLTRISKWLGERASVDEKGQALWTGLVGEFQHGRNAVLAIIADLQKKIDQLHEDQKKGHATYIRLAAPASEEAPLPGGREMREWADEAFKDFGGSRKIFGMLEHQDERTRLLSRLRAKADAEITLRGAGKTDDVDPLVLALDALSPTERQRRFAELLSRAMPWIDASWGKEVPVNAEQFKCFIGVGRAQDFRKYKDEIDQQVPVQSGITAMQVQLVDSGVPGRAVCYCELSGFPFTALRGLENWRTSYRRESQRIPVHTHRDSTMFSHPISPTSPELNQLSDDLQQFFLAVMVGVLSRDPSTRVSPPGQYTFEVEKGDARRIGNERAIRLDGLPVTYREKIVDTTDEIVGSLSAKQLAALAALAAFYGREVYKRKLISLESGQEVPRRGFSTVAAERLAAQLQERAIRKGLTQDEEKRLEAKAYESITRWTTQVVDSEADAYEWEIDLDANRSRLKRVTRPEFRDELWFERNVVGAVTPAPAASGLPGGSPPPLHVSVPPPLPQQYHVALNGQPVGPLQPAVLRQYFVAGQINPQTMIWRDGLPTWQALSSLPELAWVVAAQGPGVPPPLPPG